MFGRSRKLVEYPPAPLCVLYSSFIDSQLIEGDEAILRAAMERSEANRRHLADVLRAKPHYLHPETERALAALGQTMSAPYTIYNSAKLADMKKRAAPIRN